MYTYRITKYNPKFRNAKGSYLRDVWTQFSDIGEKFNGKTLTKKEYIKVENAYVVTLQSFLDESGILSMKAIRVENSKNIKYKGQLIKKNKVYKVEDLGELFRLILDGKFWCKFKNKDGSYVDFGWDFYTYIGIPKYCKKSIELAKKQKLYVEKFPEPILD